MTDRIKAVREAGRICSTCGVYKTREFFGTRRLVSGMVLKSSCKSCLCSKAKLWHDPRKKRNSHLKRTYNITIEDFEELLSSQDHSCAICRIHQKDSVGGILHVDHCHMDGKVRGLLCLHCSTVLGKVNDDPNILESMIGYLRKNSAD